MMRYKTKIAAVTSILILLTGCASQETKWIKSSQNNSKKDWALANSECLAEAYKTFNELPMPSNNCVGNCIISTTPSFSHGFLVGSAAKQNRKIREARDEYLESCMLSKGWQKQSM